MWRSFLVLAGVAVLHLVLSAVLLLAGAGASLGALETGSELPLLGQVAHAAGRVLLYPVFIPATERFAQSSGGWGWALLSLNSLVWAAGCYLLLRLVRKGRMRRVHSP